MKFRNLKQKNEAIKNILILGSGTIIAQLINVLIQPVLTRLISPEELGIYNLIISLSNLIIPIASLKLSMLIVISKTDVEADLLTDASIIINFFISALSLVIVSLLLFFDISVLASIGLVSLIIPFIILVNGLRFIFISHNNRFKKYQLISKVDVSRESAKGVMQITAGVLNTGIFGISLAYAISPLLGMKAQGKDYYKTLLNRKFSTLKDVLSILSKHKKHITYIVPAQLINSFSFTLITLSIISIFSPKEAGYYAISYMILGLPLVLISNNVSKVYFQNLTTLEESRQLYWSSFKKFIASLTILSILGFGVLAFIAPMFTEIIFGPGYEESGKYIQSLCFMYALRFISSSVNPGYVFFNKQKYDVVFQSILVIVGILVYLLTVSLNLSIYDYLKLISIGYGFVYLLTILQLGFITKRYSHVI